MSNKYKINLIFIVLIIISLWVLTWTIGLNTDHNIRGTFGDMFGSVNALYSGLALIGIIYTILLQRDEIKKHNRITKYQRFETTLFNLLNLHQTIVHELIFDDDDKVIKGRRVFRYIYKNKGSIDEDDDLGHYFRNIYRILKIINTEEFDEDTPVEIRTKRYGYSQILRSQLSKYELISIYKWIEKKENNNLIPLINNFSLFKNIPDEIKKSNDILDLEPQAFYPKEP
ncbi:MAG: hypothetical protein KAG37_03455 [Flavobacteriales bacterium]|nr:hypothetical protein [Flavobacteriales bacterium]